MCSMLTDFETRLQAIVDGIVGSEAPRKVIVAGPGTGKTTIFRSILRIGDHAREDRLILTFINNLKAELEETLGDLAQVLTFHGYCRRLLHSRPQLRVGLSEAFHYYPPLP